MSALSALAARISQRFRGKTQRVDRLDQFATQLHCGADAFAGLYELRQRVRLEIYGIKEVCEGVLDVVGDMTSGAERVLAEDGSYDVTEVLTHPTTRAPEAAAFHRERIEWQALETSAAERLATLRRAVPGQLAVVSQDVADARWIAIMGASYGGYAALAGLAFHPEVFAAGISVVGPSNLVSLLQSIPPHWAPVRAMFARRIGDPESAADFLRTRSPLFAAERIEAPLLVCQGANDPRVPRAESEQMVEALRAAGKAVEYRLYEDEGTT
ncbi:MAG TPA: prolyl oligopeptidase family serine peptidase [Chloroflexota bacterium]|nr:prolyl oligopeptidase family serine peptidase [Chloroflexota bacterium]